MLLAWLGDRHGRAEYRAAAAAIDAAVDTLLADQSLRSQDLGGNAGTKEITDRLCSDLSAG